MKKSGPTRTRNASPKFFDLPKSNLCFLIPKTFVHSGKISFSRPLTSFSPLVSRPITTPKDPQILETNRMNNTKLLKGMFFNSLIFAEIGVEDAEEIMKEKKYKWLNVVSQDFAEKVEFLRKQGLPDKDIRVMFVRYPRVFFVMVLQLVSLLFHFWLPRALPIFKNTLRS